MIDLNNHKVELEYPCSWKYKVVIRSEHNIKHVIKDVICEREHKLSPSKTSSKGKFESHTIEMIVHSDEDRVGMFELIRSHKIVKMVV